MALIGNSIAAPSTPTAKQSDRAVGDAAFLLRSDKTQRGNPGTFVYSDFDRALKVNQLRFQWVMGNDDVVRRHVTEDDAMLMQDVNDRNDSEKEAAIGLKVVGLIGVPVRSVRRTKFVLAL